MQCKGSHLEIALRVRSEITLEFIDWSNLQDWTNLAKLKTNEP